MTSRTRTQRVARPLVGRLEGRNAVSSLVLSMDLLAPVAVSVIGQEIEEPGADRATDLGSSFTLVSADASPPVVPVAETIRSVAEDSDPVASRRAQPPETTATVGVELGLFAPLVLTISSASPIADSGSADAAPQPVATDGGRGTAVPVPSASAATEADGIRPMKLAPIVAPDQDEISTVSGLTPDGSSGQIGGSGVGESGTGRSGGSGSGSGANPIISSITDGLALRQPDPTKSEYVVEKGVPVGTVMQAVVAPPPGSGLQFQTIAWAGGTEISSYLTTPATAPAPMTLSVGRSVNKNQQLYSFVVDPEARSYTVTVNVTYADNRGGGTAKLTFSSIRPAMASLAKDSNPVPHHPAPQGLVRYRDEVVGEGMTIKAFTKAAKDWGGQFMLIQTVQIHRSYVDANGVTHRMENVGGGPNIDNGAEELPIGMLLVNTQRSWTLAADEEGNSIDTVGEDTVIVPTPDVQTDRRLTVGLSGTPPTPESFDTYLMYRPQQNIGVSVWVALARLHWGWGISIERNAGGWSVVAGSTQNPPASPSAPIPPADEDHFWPVWTGRSGDATWD